MKNYLDYDGLLKPYCNCHKLLLTMKITILLLFCSLVNLIASPTYSQNTKISLSLKNATIEEVLNKIEDESEFYFLFNQKLVNVQQKVDIEADNEPIKNILDKILDYEIKYVVSDRQIILTPKTFLVNNDLPQQLKKITGTVTDSKGEAIIGANVIVSFTTIGTITDISGKYTIEVPRESKSLTFSFIGMQPQDVNIGTLTEINVILEEAVTGLDEVVVVGYGTQRRSDLTGSIASVKSEDIQNLPVRSITEAIQGRVAGVQVSKSSGRPGASSEIIIRGVGSINGLDPLFIIDGVARGNNVNYNPKDVASIEIIKDASAAAIYGAQAAGGVVLITTKSGTYNQKAQFNFSGNYGVRQITNTYDMLETIPYIKAKQEAGDNYALWNDPSSLPNTDWFNALFQTGIEQTYNLSATGGTENLSYFISGGYESEEGLQKNNRWERYSLRSTTDYKFSNRFKVGAKLYAIKILENPATVDIPWRTLPYMNIYNEDGTFAKVPPEVEFSGGNPVAALAYSHQKNGSGAFSGDLSADWEIFNGFHLNVLGSANISSGYTDNFTEANNLLRTASPNNYTKSQTYGEYYTLTSILNYTKTFALKHEIKALAGYEIKNSNSANLSANANQFPVDVAESFALSTNVNKTASGSLGYGRFLSQFARLNYSYANRYLLTANVRRDGSPKFGPNNRWGVFPSVSVGWKISEESFFKNLGLNWVSMIKPRLSWGILGNDAALPDFSYQKSYKTATLHSFDEVNSVAGYNSVFVINRDIKWEEIHTINGGIDFSLLQGALTASAEYYNRNTKDMIYNLPIPWSAGIGENNNATATAPVNIGSIVNKGWELSISYNNKVGDFTYNISGNLSHNENKVINLGLDNAFIYSGAGSFPFGGISPFKTVNGMPVGQVYGFQTDGLIKDQAQIDALNQVAKEKYTAETGKSASSIYYFKSLTGPGDLLFRDNDGNGRITDADRTFLGNPWPKFQYGLNLYLEWKNIDFSMDMVGLSGRDVFNCAKSSMEFIAQDFQATDKIFNASYNFGNGLTSQPSIGRINPATNKFVKDPNLNYSSYSDYFVEDGSYLKIKGLNLGYTLPKNLSSKLNIAKLRIYLTGQNLITFTKFTGLDPEFSNNTKNHGLYGAYTYPQTKLYSFGIDLSF